MSIPLFARLALIAGLTFAGLTKAATLDLIQGNNVGHAQPSLELGNANKIAVGRLNQVHSVFVNTDSQQQPAVSDIVYERYDPQAQVANSPSAWDDFQLTSDGTSTLPALALDSDGKAVVAWVSKPTPQSVLGSVWYRYQTGVNCPTCWSTPKQIVVYGTEPSITAESGTVYLAWTTRDRVQVTAFPKASPPTSPLWLGDVVDFTNCPGSKFHQPSIAFVHVPCGALNLKIAALFAADEQASAGTCHDGSTHVGPRVYERDNATALWSEVAFQAPELASSAAANQTDPIPISISLNANRLMGDFFLAWSDELSTGTRTKLGHGNGTTWDFSALDTLGHHVHVAAKGGGSASFRLAVSDQQGWSTSAYTQTGKWSGGTLSWTGAAVSIPDSTYSHVEHPQALYWSRCTVSRYQEMKVYTEADDYLPDGYNEIATDLAPPVSASCLHSIGDAVPFPNCLQSHLSIAQMVLAGGGESVLVDLGDSAVLTRLDAAGAELAALGGGTIQVTWEPGTVLSSWDNGFAVATSRGSVRFSSNDRANFTVEDLGTQGKPTGKK